MLEAGLEVSISFLLGEDVQKAFAGGKVVREVWKSPCWKRVDWRSVRSMVGRDMVGVVMLVRFQSLMRCRYWVDAC